MRCSQDAGQTHEGNPGASDDRRGDPHAIGVWGYRHHRSNRPLATGEGMSQLPPPPPPLAARPSALPPGNKTPWWKPRRSWKWWTVTVVAAFVVLSVIVTVTSPPTKPATATIPNTSPSRSAAASVQATPQPTAKPTAKPTAAPTAKPTARPTAQPTAKPTLAAATCGAPSNPWGYNFCGGGFIYSPPSNFCDYFTTCIPSFWQSTKGYVEECVDGTFSHSGGRSGSCSSHDGDRRPLYA